MSRTRFSKNNAKPAVDLTDAKVRICLRCSEAFESTGRGNRICQRCRNRKARD